jgi:hypothetical protein
MTDRDRKSLKHPKQRMLDLYLLVDQGGLGNIIWHRKWNIQCDADANAKRERERESGW